MVKLKSTEELSRMRRAGQIVAEALATMAEHVAPGMTTLELDALAEEVIRSAGATPSFLNYPAPNAGVAPFPACATISVNEQIVHGIPGARILRDGDIVSLDCGCAWRGYHADAAVTMPVGQASPEALRLIQTARGALDAGIAAMRSGAWLWDVVRTVQDYVEGLGYGVVREYQGHGIGRAMHELPNVPNFLEDPRPPNLRLRPGLTIALEPMVTAGDWHTEALADGWTIVTRDGSLAAHFEHTIAVTNNGAVILTRE